MKNLGLLASGSAIGATVALLAGYFLAVSPQTLLAQELGAVVDSLERELDSVERELQEVTGTLALYASESAYSSFLVSDCVALVAAEQTFGASLGSALDGLIDEIDAYNNSRQAFTNLEFLMRERNDAVTAWDNAVDSFNAEASGLTCIETF